MSVQPLSCMGGLNLGLTAGSVVGQCDWRRCLSELVGEGSNLIDANTKFLYLKVVESYLQTQYDSAPQDEQVQLRQYLIRWIMVQVCLTIHLVSC